MVTLTNLDNLEVGLKTLCCGSQLIFANTTKKLSNMVQFSSFNPPVVKSGSMEGLIYYLVFEATPQFTSIFLETFYSFCSPLEFFQRLTTL